MYREAKVIMAVSFSSLKKGKKEYSGVASERTKLPT